MSWSGPLLQQQFIFTASWINEKLHESQGHVGPWTSQSQRVLEPQSWIGPTQTWRAARHFLVNAWELLQNCLEVRFYQSVVASIRWVWSRNSRGWLSCRRRRSLFACLGARGSRLGRNRRSWLLTLFAGHSLLGLKLLLHHRFVLSFLNPFSELFHFSLIQAPCGNVPDLWGCYGHCSGQQLGQCLSSTSCSYKNTLGRQWQTMGMAVTEGIEMQQVGQDMTCNSDDKIVNAKVNNNNDSLSYHQLLYHEDLSE